MDSTFTPPLAPKPSQPKLWPRQARWRAPGTKAIEDPEQTRLRNFENRRKGDAKLREGLPAGLGWNVVLRINSLRNIKKALEDNGDPDKEISNILAIIEAYIDGSLSWIPGKVTYWGLGERLAPAKDFTWEECEKAGQNYSVSQGFWVEGLNIAIIPPGGGIPLKLDFIDDTGADTLSIFEGDLDQMLHLNPRCSTTTLGWAECSTVSHTVRWRVVELTLALTDPNTEDGYLMPFINVIATVQAGSGRPSLRLSGRVVRDVLFSATSPNGNRELYLTSKKSDLTNVPDTTLPITHRWRQDRGPQLRIEENPPPGANLGGTGTGQGGRGGRPIARDRGRGRDRGGTGDTGADASGGCRRRIVFW
ncbi:hypothetical protein N7481_005665 [Penicillium waksmanii]|uniref:uncharacterized protein n=1 Tax=Penicillium waksmanii TaxID=69791 RepID=UPI002546DC65|nr:uncharacterized protein N7481_005665 [Penicillium waksmanii]KAJ5983566.1 hypothetical protein N7481_005665 [Penicillium waksmanii]